MIIIRMIFSSSLVNIFGFPDIYIYQYIDCSLTKWSGIFVLFVENVKEGVKWFDIIKVKLWVIKWK